MSCVGELKKPLFTVLALIALTLDHVFLDKFDKLGHEQTKHLVLQAMEEMLKVRNVSFIKAQVENLVSFTDSLGSRP